VAQPLNESLYGCGCAARVCEYSFAIFYHFAGSLQRLHFCNILQNMLNKRLSNTPVLTIEKRNTLTHSFFDEIIILFTLDKGVFLRFESVKGRNYETLSF